MSREGSEGPLLCLLKVRNNRLYDCIIFEAYWASDKIKSTFHVNILGNFFGANFDYRLVLL